MLSPSNYKITIIGAGNVASHLGKALFKAGFQIRQVWSRNLANAKELAHAIKTDPINDLKKLDGSSDVYIFAIPDDALENVLIQCHFTEQLLVHTAGSVPMNVFNGHSKNFGVFYPLQTFSKNRKVDFRAVPVCLESSNQKTEKELQWLASSISSKVYQVDSDQRKYLHLAAVFACNYTNHMFAIAQEILEDKGLDFDLIKPLIEETASKIKNVLPSEAQTGPAMRGDEITLSNHQKLLEDHPELKEMYKLLANSIQKKGEN